MKPKYIYGTMFVILILFGTLAFTEILADRDTETALGATHDVEMPEDLMPVVTTVYITETQLVEMVTTTTERVTTTEIIYGEPTIITKTTTKPITVTVKKPVTKTVVTTKRVDQPFTTMSAQGDGKLTNFAGDVVVRSTLRTKSSIYDIENALKKWEIQVALRIRSNNLRWSTLIVRYKVYIADVQTGKSARLDYLKLKPDTTGKYLSTNTFQDRQRTFDGSMSSALKALEDQGVKYGLQRREVEFIVTFNMNDSYDVKGNKYDDTGFAVGFKTELWRDTTTSNRYIYTEVIKSISTDQGVLGCVVCRPVINKDGDEE